MCLVIVVLIILKIEFLQVYLFKNLILELIIQNSNIDEDIDLKNQYSIKNLPDPTNIQDASSKK